jgi:hypothetical protein
VSSGDLKPVSLELHAAEISELSLDLKISELLPELIKVGELS